MRKWKRLFVNGGKLKSLISTMTDFLNSSKMEKKCINILGNSGGK
jgi:hypothetical protein